ncbi:acetate uptake transporter [Chitinolyticbacter albus]|uniref:acetate uptake transporter n=1 Tax=Chitinolyticbacter albus TaxID=2961951 RepID=UPI00210D29B1|nr:acetate uptake transporter [Chitinolyticbacter albus]
MSASQSSFANPAPLGLMGFGMTTILLNIHNAGFYPVSAMIMSMGIFYGGLAQIFVGFMCFKRGDTFGTTAFTSYGLFWLTLVLLWLLPALKLTAPTEPGFMGMYLALWGVFTLFMFFGSLRYCRAKQFVFGSLTVLFALLAAHNFAGSELLGVIAGYVGIVCGASAIYWAMAQVLNETYGRAVLPVGELRLA